LLVLHKPEVNCEGTCRFAASNAKSQKSWLRAATEFLSMLWNDQQSCVGRCSTWKVHGSRGLPRIGVAKAQKGGAVRFHSVSFGFLWGRCRAKDAKRRGKGRVGETAQMGNWQADFKERFTFGLDAFLIRGLLRCSLSEVNFYVCGH
jgi:hypothetical protein